MTGADSAAPSSQPDSQPEVRPGIQPGIQLEIQSGIWSRTPYLLAALFLVVELVVADRYGFEQDELYFIADGHRPALGYVDQGPLSPLLAAATDWPGHGPFTVRILPALFGAAIVLASARTARIFGAGRLGQSAAALAAACSPVVVGAAHELTTTPLDLLCWTLALMWIAEAVLRERPRLWLAAGAAVGIGLEDKDLILTLLVALGVALAATRAGRARLRTRWPWLALAVAVLPAAPNLIWQAMHGWPLLTMSAALRAEHSSGSDYVTALPAQLVYPGLFAIPLIAVGLVRLLREEQTRFLGIAAIALAAYVVLSIPGRPYYDAGVLPLLLGAGADLVERAKPRLRHTILIGIPVSTLLTLETLLPIQPVAAEHTIPGIAKANSDLGDTIGWPQLADAVAADVARLTADGTAPTSIYADSYAEAAAIAYYDTGQPPVLSGHNQYWLWGPGDASDAVVLVIGRDDAIAPHFRSCTSVSVYQAPFDVDNDFTPLPISLCTGPHGSWADFWPSLRAYN